jgi:membrane protein involved in colicin uptake
MNDSSTICGEHRGKKARQSSSKPSSAEDAPVEAAEPTVVAEAAEPTVVAEAAEATGVAEAAEPRDDSMAAAAAAVSDLVLSHDDGGTFDYGGGNDDYGHDGDQGTIIIL